MNKIKPWRYAAYVILIALICLAPFWVANYVYQHRQQFSLVVKPHGDLLKKLPNIDQLNLQDQAGRPFAIKDQRGHWLLMYVSQDCCQHDLCQRNVYNMRALRGILVKDDKRFHSYVLMPESCRSKSLPKIMALDDSVKPWYASAMAMQSLQQHVSLADHAHIDWSRDQLLLVDPHTYVVMRYAGDQHPINWLQDFKKLLRVPQYA